MPIRPSAGNWLISEPGEYWYASPSVWLLALVWYVNAREWEEKCLFSPHHQACDVGDIMYCSPLMKGPPSEIDMNDCLR